LSTSEADREREVLQVEQLAALAVFPKSPDFALRTFHKNISLLGFAA
jgi:hypothetical protein